jgi:hypothetical protein
MSVNFVSGFHGDSAGSQSSLKQICTLPAGSWLTRIDINGYANLTITTVTYTAGNYATYDIAAGIQYGTSGYGGTTILGGSTAGANWITFGEMVPASIANQGLAGSSPQNAVQAVGYPLQLRWRGLKQFTQASDVYVAVGVDNSKSYAPNFETYYTWYIEWAQ